MVRRRLLYGTLPELCDTLRVVLPSFVTTFIIFVPSEVMATGGELGIVESADEAPAPVKKTVEHCERRGTDSHGSITR